MKEALETVPRDRSSRKKILKELIIIGSITLIVAIVFPLVLPAFRLKTLGRFLALSIVALGIDLIWGYTGILSLGHGIFFALGGYALAMYLKNFLPYMGYKNYL
jgi:urea transport system permease protein